MSEPSQSSDWPSEEHPLLYQDELTGLYNRRFFNRAYEDETLKAAEAMSPLAVLMLDIDYFKTINDRHGHKSGDLLLTQVGQLLNETVGKHGFSIRYAGDEFCVLMPGATVEAAMCMGEQIVEAARARQFSLADRTVDITLSVGVAHYPDDVREACSLFEAADRGAYLAKKGGRNQVARYRPQERREIDAANLHSYFPCEQFVGRDDLILELIGVLTTAPGKRRPWAVVSGEAGIGKTRLLQEVGRRLDQQRHFVLEAVGLPHLLSQPYAMLLTPLSVALRHSTQALSRLASSLNSDEIDAIVGLLPELKRYAASSSPSLRPSPRTSQTQFVALQNGALCKVIRALAQDRVPVLILDDLHHADKHSLHLLRTLRIQANESFVCLAVSDEGEQAAGSELSRLLKDLRHDRATLVMRLQPLSSEDVSKMLEAILPGAAAHDLLGTFVCGRSQGRPLLVEESLKLLIQRATVKYDEGRLVVGDLDGARIPKDARGLLDARAEQTDEEVRLLMSRAAVIGTWFDLGTLMQVEEKNEGWLSAVLERARKASIIAEVWTGEHFRYSFASAQMHVAFYQMLARDERAEIERKVRSVRARQKAARLAASTVKMKRLPLETMGALEAFQGCAMLAFLAAAMMQSQTWLDFPWLCLAVGTGAPPAWQVHQTRPIPPARFFERAFRTMALLIACGTAADFLGPSARPGFLQMVGIGRYAAAMGVQASLLGRVLSACALAAGYAVLLRLDAFSAVSRLAPYHLEWLPQLMPAVALALLGAVVGEWLSRERAPADSAAPVLAWGGALGATGGLLILLVSLDGRTLSASFLLVSAGTGLLLLGSLATLRGMANVAPLLFPLQSLGRKLLLGLAVVVLIGAGLNRLPLSMNLSLALRVFIPFAFALLWVFLNRRSSPGDFSQLPY